MPLTLCHLVTQLAQATQSSGSGASGNTSLMIWALMCFGIAFVLVVLEAFLPTGGIMGALAGIAAIVGIALFFGFDTTWGLASMAITFLSLPFILAGMVWVWPNTPLGRALTLKDEQLAERDKPREPGVAVGTTGTALTDLRPIGACRLDGKRNECLAVGAMIEQGATIEVVRVEGSTIQVREV